MAHSSSSLICDPLEVSAFALSPRIAVGLPFADSKVRDTPSREFIFHR